MPNKIEEQFWASIRLIQLRLKLQFIFRKNGLFIQIKSLPL